MQFTPTEIAEFEPKLREVVAAHVAFMAAGYDPDLGESAERKSLRQCRDALLNAMSPNQRQMAAIFGREFYKIVSTLIVYDRAGIGRP